MLLERYSQLLSEIACHAERAGRDPAAIQLVAVTKYAVLEQMQEAYRLGIRHFGESRLQTALPKIAQFPSDVRWHFIGPLQSNKIGKIVGHFDYIHSVGSLEFAAAIAKKSRELQKRPYLFLQVNTSGETSKQGFSEDDLLLNFEAVADLDLKIIGLMTMAPLNADELMIKTCFYRLRALCDRLSLKMPLPHLSMGMSLDFSIAIAEGGTFLRIGSRLF